MKETLNIIQFYNQLKAQGSEASALAVVVKVEGSSYRRMGARMLVCENGTWVGGISGGCLEGDALKRARLSILKEKPSSIVYDTTTDDDNQIGVGLGCNGVIEVLFIPIKYSNSSNPVELLINATKQQVQPNFLLTFSGESKLMGKVINYQKADDLKEIQEELDTGQLVIVLDNLEASKNIIISSSIKVFAEYIKPNISLYIFGNQYDIYPLIALVNYMSWNVTIVANPAKIDNSDVEIISPENFDINVLDVYTAVVLMSHSLETDTHNYTQVLNSKAKYIGVLGPKARFEKILESLGHKSTPANVYAPIGLDLGSTSPEEIALSIVSEIQAVFSDRAGKSLKKRILPINNRDEPMVFKV